MEIIDLWWIAWGFFLAAAIILVIHFATKSHCVLDGPICDGFFLPEIGKEWDVTYNIPSRSVKNTEYQINLYHMQCSCSNFQEKRAGFSRLDARRMCNHIAYEMEAKKVINTYDQLSRAVVCHAARKQAPYCFAKVRTKSGPAWIVYVPKDRWLYVIAPFSWPKDAEHRRDYTYAFAPKIWTWALRKRPKHYPQLERCCNRISQERFKY